jgi:rhodanese-related sulfurtransferase
VLTDDDGVRARMTATWLNQLGYLDVHVLDDEPAVILETGPEPLRVLGSGARVNWIEADQLALALSEKTAQVIDIDSSLAFRRAHVQGARFIAASALSDLLDQHVDSSVRLVLTSEDGVLAGLVANQIRSRVPGVAALLGGTRRWLALALPSGSGDAGNLTGSDDAWYSPYHAAPEQVATQMNAYLAWELQLVEQVERDGTGSIKVIDFDTHTAHRSRERLASFTSATTPA